MYSLKYSEVKNTLYFCNGTNHQGQRIAILPYLMFEISDYTSIREESKKFFFVNFAEQTLNNKKFLFKWVFKNKAIFKCYF